MSPILLDPTNGGVALDSIHPFHHEKKRRSLWLMEHTLEALMVGSLDSWYLACVVQYSVSGGFSGFAELASLRQLRILE